MNESGGRKLNIGFPIGKKTTIDRKREIHMDQWTSGVEWSTEGNEQVSCQLVCHPPLNNGRHFTATPFPLPATSIDRWRERERERADLFEALTTLTVPDAHILRASLNITL